MIYCRLGSEAAANTGTPDLLVQIIMIQGLLGKRMRLRSLRVQFNTLRTISILGLRSGSAATIFTHGLLAPRQNGSPRRVLARSIPCCKDRRMPRDEMSTDQKKRGRVNNQGGHGREERKVRLDNLRHGEKVQCEACPDQVPLVLAAGHTVETPFERECGDRLMFRTLLAPVPVPSGHRASG
jgi:hypothetical protein